MIPALSPRTRPDQLDPPGIQYLAAIVASRGCKDVHARVAWLAQELGHELTSYKMQRAAARWERMRRGMK